MLRTTAIVALILWGNRATYGQAADPTPRPTVHLVSRIDVRDFGAETVRIGDLNSDGAPDLLLVQSVYGTVRIQLNEGLGLIDLLN